MSRLRFRFIASVVALVCVLVVPDVSAQNLGNSIKVDRLEFDVTLSDGNTYTMVGYLYYHGSFRERPLQVLVHGATYNHTYWDFPTLNGQSYSYARYMAARRYAVLAVDQLGAGESDKPNGTFLTLAETGSALAQAIAQLRTADNPVGYAFARIALVGHSAGSINTTVVQGQTQLADALVLTASRHLVPPLAVPPGLLDLVVALLPFEYFVLPPEIRTLLFYYPVAADPDVIAADNATADVWTNGQLTSTFFAFLNPGIDRPDLVKGSVLVQLGENDFLFPAGQNEIEAALWPSADLTIQTLPGIGHDFNLHLNHEPGWAQIDAWLREKLGR